MNILVTGGAGYIGSHTVVELMNGGYHPIIVDDLSNAHYSAVDRIGKITDAVFRSYSLCFDFFICESHKLFDRHSAHISCFS